jgi:hypothetical protein
MTEIVERIRSAPSVEEVVRIVSEEIAKGQQAATEIAALREQYLQSQTDLQNAIGDRDEAIKQQIRAEARAETAERKLAEARGALKPFARLCDLHVDADMKDTTGIIYPGSKAVVQVGHLRAARAIMEE